MDNKTAAIICQVEKKHVNGRLGGGIQAVERLHAELLSELGFKVDFLTTADSDDIYENEPNIETVRLGPNCEECYEADGTGESKQARGKLNRERSAAIRDHILQTNPSVVINHSFSSSQLKLCVELSERFPVLTFLHCVPEAAADMGMFAKLEAYRKLTERGSELVCVSYYQRDRWATNLMRRIASGSKYFDFLVPPIDGVPAVQAIFNRVCYSTAVSEKKEVKPAEDYYIVIGRPEPDKNIGRLLSGLVELKKQGIEPKVKVFIAFSGKLEDYEHYNTKMVQHLPHLPNVELCCNRPRTELMEAISGAKALIVTMLTEASPVAPIEALTYGVPPIVFAGKTPDGALHHACFDNCADGVLNLKTYIPVSVDRKIFVEQLKSALLDDELTTMQARERLRDLALTNHHRDIRRKELEDAVEDVMERYAHIKDKPSLFSF